MEKLKRRSKLYGATDLKKSSRKNNKWMVRYNDKWIHFGNPKYEDYTQHGDKIRRENYLRRSKGIRDGKGNLTYKNKSKSNYWSRMILW